MSTNHYARAEALLERAAELEGGPRHTVAKTLATIAQAHATLALVKATRQQSELLAERPPAPDLSPAERAIVDRFETAPDALAEGGCTCSTMPVGTACPTHDVALPGLDGVAS